jgi:hypothetical protein
LWLQDLKRVLKKAGLEGRDTVFLFSDTQIVQESFLEDINSILNSGGQQWAAAIWVWPLHTQGIL